jgi:HEAT repeats
MRRPAARSTLCELALVAVTGALLGATAFAASAELPGRVLDVAVESGRLSLRAHEARLADVLEAIGRQAGVRIVLHGDLDTPVTETFVNLPLDEGVRRLSRWHSVVLIYGPLLGRTKGQVLTEVWVMDSSQAQGPAEQPARDKTPRIDARAGARPPEDQRGWTSDLTTALKYGKSTNLDQTVETLVREQGEYRVVAILREAATRDPDPRVRRGAIRVLASMNSPDAVDAVGATLRDPHPGVRYEADMALRRQSRARSSDGSVD